MEINGEELEAPRDVDCSTLDIHPSNDQRDESVELWMVLEMLQWSRGDQPSFMILSKRYRSMQLLVFFSRREGDLIYSQVTWP